MVCVYIFCNIVYRFELLRYYVEFILQLLATHSPKLFITLVKYHE